VAVLLAWSALHIFIVPRIGDYREALQQQATRTLGLRVDIGQIQAQGGWWVPWFELNDIQLYDREGREALRLPRVLAAVSPLSVLRGKFEQLDIEQPELEIRRDAQGHVWVAGLDTREAGDGGGADWLFSQPEIVVRSGVVHWRDESRPAALQTSAPVLTLQGVDVVIHNPWFRHELRAEVTPPEAVGKRLSVRGKFFQAPWHASGDVGTWSGESFAELPHVDLATLRQWVPMDKGVSLQEGRGAVRLWSDVQQGALIGVTADVALDAVDVRLGAELLPLSLRRVSGRLGAQALGDEVEISSHDLVFDTQEGEHWPGGVLRVSWARDTFASGSLQADRLDLEALNQISQRLPLPEKLRATLSRVQPQGQVNQLKATWQKTDQAFNYTAHGQVRQLAMRRDVQADSPLAHLPGLQGAQLEFDLSQKGGKARISVSNGGVTLPLGLDEPHLVLQEASAQLAWQRKGEDVALQFTQGKVVNDDLSGEFSGNWKNGEGDARWPGVLDLTASIHRAKVAQVYRYLPNALPADVRSYVRDAVRGGEASRVSLRLRGNLNDMPFDDPKQGEFRIVVQLADGEYAYVPPVAGKSKGMSVPQWPALKQLNGELVFDRSALHFKGRTQLAGAPDVTWQKVEAHIPNLAQTVVSVTGEGRGPLQQVLDTVAKTALNDLTGGVLHKSQGKGDANYKLALTLPTQQLDAAKVQGSVGFVDNALQVIPGTPVLGHAKGTLHFSEQGFQLESLRAELLGGEATLAGGLSFAAHEDKSPLQLKIEGQLTAEGLRQARELGIASRLAQRATGKAAYTATLGLRRGQPELLIQSDLKGMTLGLPAPLNKAASAAMPLRIEQQLTPESLLPKARVLQDQIKVSLDRWVVYVRDLTGPRARVVRGGIAVGQSALDALPMRDNAVSLNLQLATVDLDAWGAVMSQATGASLVKTKASNKSVVGQEASADNAQDYIPTFATIQAGQVKVADRFIHQVVIGGTRQADVWRMNISADELNGSAEVRSPNGNVPAQLYVRLAYLNIPPSSVPDVERLLTEQPSSIPSLDIVVNALTLRDKKLGRLEIDAINRAGANSVREWRLNKLNLAMPEATFNASGNWAATGPRTRRTHLNFALVLRDSGGLLARLGTPDAIRGGEGRLEGEVSWQGSPITLDYASMDGKMNLLVEKGQFLKTEPGAARLLGVLNLQALPRRLTLDFRDVFSEGFAFDFVRGDVRIEKGIALTNNLQMKGVVAGALIEGRADIVRETQNLKVVVVPEINAGTASLYVATINPLVGLTSYLAQMVLSKPLVRAGTSEFHIDGTWADPRVTKVD
jgi:uncharacterized protein (TIGR02099 family)